MYQQLKKEISLFRTNRKGWKTDRKILVIESDDWGAVRIPSLFEKNSLIKAGMRLDRCPYMSFDSIETENDLAELFNLLLSLKDKSCNHPVITANAIMANPDFDRIQQSEFKQYSFVSVAESFQQNEGSEKCLNIWKEGNKLNIFRPQLHGREHLNISKWMTDLMLKNPETILGFKNKVYGISTTVTKISRESYLAAFGKVNESYPVSYSEIINSANELFVSLLGFSSRTFIAPNYTWNIEVEAALARNGIHSIQGTRIQNSIISNKQHLIEHYLGERNEFKQIYLIRNVNFEPSFSRTKNWVDNALKEVSRAFLYKKPAVVSMHRVNFSGKLNVKNRENSLIQLDKFLRSVINKWPDVEFMSSDNLANCIYTELIHEG